MSLALSAAIVVIAMAVVLGAVDYIYVRRHPIAVVEEDLGYGLVMVFTLLGSAVVALPAWGVVAWKIKRYFASRLR